ncbi:MAG TPA: hypothetical protein VLG69_04770, partial [Candidatus Andersenbacteria bacterium]|nr:hypothetical protein [Candidatus Andersenbacteria bacterium]
MAEISIQIDWVYALGILGTLLVMAWQAGSRFARIDTLLKNLNEKVKDTEDRILEVKRELSERIDELKNDLDNVRFNIFANHSPIHLTEDGILHLQESGMKEYIDTHTEELMERFPDA